ncbi:MAG: amidohydrolase [candidate division KSB1 bacterium]|nr:amidohydrolase [candidate division KSB1 bacterium]MDZ7275286.1 amidohydrolase [candidate division KSB1 bacterium]MDZ7287454.1 amidohydrolase [candidate division KSB1 bacterium]MDZ7299568.1 amidohydrolase [candidate division KSB1 bacterium]MDZ7308026.1 amidohydrolase [candidate division KSB1 bacterium]
MISCETQQQAADLVLKNGTILTVDANNTIAQAVAVNGNRITFVGSNQAVERLIGSKTRVIDLHGRTVVPGLIDSHYHFQGVGKREFDLNLDGCTSLIEFLKRLENWAASKPGEEWITGRGWMEEDWPVKQFPTRHDLDRVVPDRPVCLNRADGHMAVVNSRALAIAGIDAATPDPAGGEILKDESGKPNGLLVDRAMALVTKHIPTHSREMQERYAITANNVALAYGLTTVHDAGSGWETINLWKSQYRQGRLKVRLYAFVRGPGADADSLLQRGPEIGLFDHHLTIRGVKISADGALGSRGAALLEKYADDNSQGLFLFKDEEIYPVVKAATERGVQMAIHAIGDAANRKVLTFYEKALAEVPIATRKVAEPRHRIEHAQIVADDDLPRFARLGVLPVMQASHAIGDLHFAVRRLGLTRLRGAYAWRTLIDSGCRIAGGSDAPVEEGNPMIEFYAAVVRKDTTGFSGEGWHPELRMTRLEALKSLTIWGAYAAFEEDLKGTIEVGKLADFAVLDQDPITAPEASLFRIKNMMTIVGGEIVYDREQGGILLPEK